MGEDYASFWTTYLRAHGRRETRGLHYVGTSAGLALLAGAALRRDWRPLIAAPALGYALAWAGHALIEGNRPQTFGHPLWSLVSDFRMLALAASGRLGPHLRRAGIAP